MASISENLFGTLSIDYCAWFLFLSILGFIWFVIYVISAIYLGVIKRKGGDYWMTMIAVAFGYFIFYFQNRLLHTMCVRK